MQRIITMIARLNFCGVLSLIVAGFISPAHAQLTPSTPQLVLPITAGHCLAAGTNPAYQIVDSGVGCSGGGSVVITGGTINGTAIGATTPSTGAFTTLTGSSTPTGGTTDSTIANLFARAISVTDFGAKCDGTTDDHVAINAALSTIAGGIVRVPFGAICNVGSAGISVPANTQLICPDNGGSGFISSANPGNPVVSLAGNFATVENCQINGNSIANGIRTSDGIRVLAGVSHAKVLYNQVLAAADNGIEDNGNYNEIAFNYVHDNYTNGIYVIGQSGGFATNGDIHDNTVIHNSAGTLSWDGIDLDPCHSGYRVHDNHVEGNDIIVAGAYTSGTSTCATSFGDMVTANLILTSAENGIALLGQLRDELVNNNLVYTPTGWCIYDNTAGYATFRLNIQTNECIGSTKDGIYLANFVTPTVTISIATPAVITLASHGLFAGEKVVFATTGALPTGLTAGTTYYVISAGLTSGAFEVSATSGGSAVNTSGSQSGVQTVSGTGGLTGANLIGNTIENQAATFSGVTIGSNSLNINIQDNVITPNLGAYAVDTSFAYPDSSVRVIYNTLNAGATGTINSLSGQTVTPN